MTKRNRLSAISAKNMISPIFEIFLYFLHFYLTLVAITVTSFGIRKTIMANKGGRHATFAHTYFSRVPNTNDSRCLIAKEDGSPCGILVRSGHRYGNNLKSHLSNYHADIRKIVDDEDNKNKATPTVSTSPDQPKITEFTAKMKPYKAGGIEDTRITEALALYFGGTNCPKSMVEHPLFINLLETCFSKSAGRFRQSSIHWLM